MANNNLGSGVEGVRGALGSLLEPAMVFAATGSKAAAIFAGMKGTLIGSVLGPITLISGAMIGVLGVIKQVVKQSDLLAKGMEKVRQIETLETQFQPLIGGAERAQKRIEELYHFAASTPFQLTEIAEASRTLEVLSKGALSTGKSLRAIGDAAAVSGQGMQTVAFWTGRLYDGLKSGRPIGEATNRLQEMGILSGVVRNKIDTLAKSGADFNKTWAVFEEGLESSKGGMENLSKTLGGLESTLSDVRGLFAAKFAENFLEGEKESVKVLTGFLVNMMPVVEKLGAILGTISNTFVKFSTAIAKVGGNGKNLASTLKILMDAFAVLAIALPVIHFLKIAQAMKAVGAAGAISAVGTRASAMSAIFSRTAHMGLVKQLQLTTAWFFRQSAGAKLAAGSGLILGGVVKGLTAAMGMLAGAIKAAFTALLTGPALIITVLATIAVSLFKVVNGANKAREAVKEATNAFKEFKKVIEDSSDSMQTLADKTALLRKIREEISATSGRITDLEIAEGNESFLSDVGGKITGTDTAELDAQKTILKQLNQEYAKIAESKNANLRASEKQVELLRREVEVARALRDVELSRVGQMGPGGAIFETEGRLSDNNEKLTLARRENQSQKELEDFKASDSKTRRDAAIERLKSREKDLDARAEKISQQISETGIDTTVGRVDVTRPFSGRLDDMDKALEENAAERRKVRARRKQLEKDALAADPRKRLTQQQLDIVQQEGFTPTATAFGDAGAPTIGDISRELEENDKLTQKQRDNLEATKAEYQKIAQQAATFEAINKNLTAELRVQNAEHQRAVGLLAAQNKHHRTAMQIFKETEGGRRKALESDVALAQERLAIEKQFGEQNQNLEELRRLESNESDPAKREKLRATITRIEQNDENVAAFQRELDKANHSLKQFGLELAESIRRINHEISSMTDNMEFDRAIRLNDGQEATQIATRQAQRDRAEEERRLRRGLVGQGFEGPQLDAKVREKMAAKDAAAQEKFFAEAHSIERQKNRAMFGMQERVFASDGARRNLERMDNQEFARDNFAKNLRIVTKAGLVGEEARKKAADMTASALDAKIMQQIPAMKTTADEFRKLGRGGGAISNDPMKILAEKRLNAQKDTNAILGRIDKKIGQDAPQVIKAG